MKHSARQLGFRIAEVPIRFIDRQVGESKMNMGIFREAFLGVLSMRFRPVKPAR
jgi:dolichol-phosphate mannosyltransferase